MSDLTSPEVEPDERTPLPVLYEDLRKLNVPIDFTINVEDNTFSVHRQTIITHSEYFRAMLEHDTKEKQQEFVDIKYVPIVGVKECVEFMYTGLVDVNAENVEDILKTADMWQLSKVKNDCGNFLKGRLDSGNCVSMLSIATKYCWSDLQAAALRIYKDYFEIELSELLQLSKDNFIKFIETHTLGNDVAWDAVSNWIKHDYEKKSEFVFTFLKLLNWDALPSPKLLETIWSERMVRSSPQSRKFLFKKLFLDLETFKSCLGVKSYFALKELSGESEYVIKQIKDMLSDFFKHKIVLLSQNPEFKNLNLEEILPLFTSEKSDVFASEKWFWNTAVMWVRHDPDRKSILPQLIRFIKFNQMPESFTKFLLRTEPLIKESQECFDIILNALLQPKKKTEVTDFVGVLYSDGRVRALNIITKSWEDLAKFPEPVDNAVIFYFNRKLCLVNGTKLFYLQNKEWILKSSMSSGCAGRKYVATSADFFYVVCNRNLCCYSLLTDSWNVTELPSDCSSSEKTTTCIAALNHYVYLHRNAEFSDEENMYWRLDVEANKWSQRNAGFRVSDLLTIDDEVYSCDSDGNLKEFDVKGESSWKSLESRKRLEKKKPISSGFDFDFSPRIYRDPISATQHLLNINRGIFRVIGGNEIYSYDELYKTWRSHSNIPIFSAGIKGQESEIRVVSVCPYFVDAVVDSPSQKRRKIE